MMVKLNKISEVLEPCIEDPGLRIEQCLSWPVQNSAISYTM